MLMQSPVFQVLRWGALVLGVFYGFSHQSAIHSQDKKAAAQHAWDRKEKIIIDAKAAWAEKQAPPQPEGAAGGSGGESYVRVLGLQRGQTGDPEGQEGRDTRGSSQMTQLSKGWLTVAFNSDHGSQ